MGQYKGNSNIAPTPNGPFQNSQDYFNQTELEGNQKSFTELYRKIKNNPRLQKKEREYLLHYVKDGTQPIFGYPHMSFASKECFQTHDYEWQTQKNWNRFTKSILKEQCGKSEVQKVFDVAH